MHGRHNLHELPELTGLHCLLELPGQQELQGLHGFKSRTSQTGCSRRAAGRIGKRLAEQMAVKPADWPAYRTVELIALEHASWIIEYRPAEQTAGWLKDQAAEQMTDEPSGQIVWQPDWQQEILTSSKALQQELMQRGRRAAGAHCQVHGSLRCAENRYQVFKCRNQASCAQPQKSGSMCPSSEARHQKISSRRKSSAAGDEQNFGRSKFVRHGKAIYA